MCFPRQTPSFISDFDVSFSGLILVRNTSLMDIKNFVLPPHKMERYSLVFMFLKLSLCIKGDELGYAINPNARILTMTDCSGKL